jgi:hypothetical protein
VDDDQGNSGIVYDSNWTMWKGNGGYLNTEHCNRNPSELAEATFTFTGTRVRYYGFTRYDLGIVDVYLDNIKVATIDLFGQNGETVLDKLLYESGQLALGAHTLKIKGTNSKNPRSAGTGQIIDAFEYSTYVCSNCRAANAEVASRKQMEALTLQVHPNPASSEVTIDLSGFAGESAVQVKMSDMTGKLHLGQQVQMGEGVEQVTLPVNHLPQGLFFVTVQGSKVARTAKLMITK